MIAKTYVGNKIVNAWPEEKDGQEGYGISYEDGYKSWSPKETFERAYREITEKEKSLIVGKPEAEG